MASTLAALSLLSVPAYAGADREHNATAEMASISKTVHQDTTFAALWLRLFPVIGKLARSPESRASISNDPTIRPVLEQRKARRDTCAQDVSCFGRALVWNDAEVKAFASAATALAPSITPDDVTRELQGVNTILETYGLGQTPRYPTIDGSGPIKPEEQLMRLQAAYLIARRSYDGIDPAFNFALALLDGSDRTDAIGYEPLSGGLNEPAMQRATGIDWKAWRYSALIVTGVGPEVDGMSLSPLSKYHIRLAAERFAAGEAPFIILTGGRAHPRGTRFAEAEEMRKGLIERYGVPASAIVIEPYARHTTTNLRNASRLLMLLQAPLEKEALIVCNEGQSAYIESAQFSQRNLAELGFQPGRIVKRLAPTELVFLPSIQSRQVDPRDPLDP